MPFLRKATDTPYGFRPYGEVLRCSSYQVDAGAAALYPGDLVILEADGALAIGTASAVNMVGSAAIYNPASTAHTAFLVYDHPDQRFHAQDDGAVGIMTATSLGSRCAIVATAGSTTTFQSQQEIDSSSASTTATEPVSIHALHPVEQGSHATTTGQQRRWICSLNNQLWSGYQQAGI